MDQTLESIALLKIVLRECLPLFCVSWVITKRQYRSTRSPGPEVRVSALILTPCVTLGSDLPSEGLCFHMCKMGTIAPAYWDSCEDTRDHSCEWGFRGVLLGLWLPICFVFFPAPS